MVWPSLRRTLQCPGGQRQRRRLFTDGVRLCLGSEEFKQDFLAAEADKAGASHYGSDRFETSQEKPERIIAQRLKPLG